jgi:O-antigen/teichoic acid export membrane protein
MLTTAALGSALGGVLQAAILGVSPWLPAIFLQQTLRGIAFRDGRGRPAALGDVVSFLTFGVLALTFHAMASPRLLLAWWGIGSIAAASVLIIARRGALFVPLRTAGRWFQRDAFPFARWLVADWAVFTVATYSTILALTTILGASAVGGLRAIESIFSPLSILAPAVTLVAQPQVVLRMRQAPQQARRMSLSIGVAVGSLTLAYTLVLAWKHSVLGLIFGSEFDRFTSLVPAIGLAQVSLALALGPTLVLKAQRSGRLLVIAHAVGLGLSSSLTIGLAVFFGLQAAAWGIAAGAGATMVLLFFCTRASNLMSRTLVASPQGAFPTNAR